MNDYLLFLETLYRAAKKMRIDGPRSIVKHLNSPAKSRILLPVAEKLPVAPFMFDSLQMLAAGLSLEELTFYMDGYRHRLIAHEKADVHLVNLVFRTVWAIAHVGWEPIMCTEFGRATIPAAMSLPRSEWLDHCNSFEVDRTQTVSNWDLMLEEMSKGDLQ